MSTFLFMTPYVFFSAYSAVTVKSGSELVLIFLQTLKRLNKKTSLIEFLTMLSGEISGQVYGAKMYTQTPQVDVFPHVDTVVYNSKR